MTNKKSCAKILLSAGTGSRIGGENKLLRDLGGKNAIELCLETAEKCKIIDYIIIIVNDITIKFVESIVQARVKSNNFSKPLIPVFGGKSRGESVWNGLACLEKISKYTGSIFDIVAIHDCARPFVTCEIISDCIESARVHGSGIAGIELVDSIKRVDENMQVCEDIDRSNIWRMQTPQCFRFDDLMLAYEETGYDFSLSDDSAVWIKSGRKAHIIKSEESNYKLTNISDIHKASLDIAKSEIKNSINKNELRIGYGEDIHVLGKNRKLMLGGVDVPFGMGLVGHSDADVLVHAIIDALLGAMCEGDIGMHFSDDNPDYLNVNSLSLLKEVYILLEDSGYQISNIDCTIMAERPKLLNYILEMRKKLSAILNVDISKINIKATTSEGVNAEGEGVAISARAVALIYLA